MLGYLMVLAVGAVVGAVVAHLVVRLIVRRRQRATVTRCFPTEASLRPAVDEDGLRSVRDADGQ